MKSVAVWTALAAAMLLPLIAAAFSPWLAWRQPVYIAAGFSGIAAMSLLLLQPLLADGKLPGLSAAQSRHLHRWTGATLTLAVILHVAGLWITSPPDVIDALTFTSPTLFSPFGVIAMWAILATALWAALRRHLSTRPRTWRRTHKTLAALIVMCTVAHALLIEGTMETITKWTLSCLVLLAAARAIWPRQSRQIQAPAPADAPPHHR